MYKLSLIVCCLFSTLFGPHLFAQETETVTGRSVAMHFFWGKGCPHCDKQKVFIDTLKRRHPELSVTEYEVRHNKKNAELFQKIMTAAKVTSVGVPATIVGNRLFIGFNEQTAGQIREAVVLCKKEGCVDAVAELSKAGLKEQEAPKQVEVPLFGRMDSEKLSLPLFTIIMAGMDGFNPCAFFVLLFLLSLLLHVRSRRRMLLIGGVFVLFSAAIYFVFMAAWLNIFLLIGQLTAVTVTAGVIAVIVAAVNIKDFFLFKKGLSLAIPETAKPRLFERMRNLIKAQSLASMISGAVVLAIVANAYELLCTAGFPMVYTRVLTLRGLSKAEYYVYLAAYNVIYVVPLIVIVIIITATLGARKLSEWQGRQLKLTSGLMMLFLGGILLINPEVLNNVFASIGLLSAALVLSLVIIAATKRLKPDRAA